MDYNKKIADSTKLATNELFSMLTNISLKHISDSIASTNALIATGSIMGRFDALEDLANERNDLLQKSFEANVVLKKKADKVDQLLNIMANQCRTTCKAGDCDYCTLSAINGGGCDYDINPYDLPDIEFYKDILKAKVGIDD